MKPNEPITSALDQFYTTDVEPRIKHLEGVITDVATAHQGRLKSELVNLLQLRELGTNFLKNWGEGYALTRDDCMARYALYYWHNETMLDLECEPFCHIDWDAAADYIRKETPAVTFDGATYWLVGV